MESQEAEDDVPDVVVGEVVYSDNGDLAYNILRQIGSGRCCVVFSGSAVRDGSLVALKFFRPGAKYEGAVQRERFILDTVGRDPSHNLVTCYGYMTYRGLHCVILELLDINIRQIIFKNDRHGLSAWATTKFAKDILIALQVLHQAGLVHGDLKPANILWSREMGVFKVIDFGLSFSVEEEDLHQVQSSGYRAPEAATWNSHKEDLRQKRKRKLQGTYLNLTHIGTTSVLRESQADDCNSYHPNSTESPKTVPYVPFKNLFENDSTETLYTRDVIHNVITSTRSSNQDQTKETSLQHSDSQSSGIFSQESSDRSQCSSRLSWDGGDVSEAKGVKHRVEGGRAGATDRKKEDAQPWRQEIVLRTKRNNVTTTSKDILSDEKAFGGFEEQVTTQDWRKTRGRSVHIPERELSPTPCPPGPPSDIWSLGCLLTEALTGRKLFRAGDKLASVLRPAQLLEMKLGEREVECLKSGEEEFFTNIKDLIVKCIVDDSSLRISAKQALKHPLFSLNMVQPSKRDLTVLPSPVLQFCHKERQEEGDKDALRLCDEMLADLRSECEEYGEITECCMAEASGRAYVHFQEEAWLIF